ERRTSRRERGGIGAGAAGGDVDGPKTPRRHAGDRQEAVGHRASQKETEGKERGADRPADERFGEAHAAHAVTPPRAAKARAGPAGRARSAAAPGGSTASSRVPSRDR